MNSSLPYRHVTRIRSAKRHSSTTSFSLELFKNAQSAEQVLSFSATQLEAADKRPRGDVFPWLKGLPEVIVTGRANSGKSSLFNAVLGRKDLIKTSSKAGKTRRLDFFRVGTAPGKLILVDSPGYGDRGRPEWGQLFDSYVQNRKELRRVYITFNAKHPINDRDQQMLAHLTQTLFKTLSTEWASSLQSGNPRLPRITHIQPVITKADHLPSNPADARLIVDRFKREIQDAVKNSLADSDSGRIGVPSSQLAKLMCLSPLVTTLRLSPPFGIGDIRRNIVEACT
ncbi:P-loop containing nucleoside triphosphate hydrolase protein [Lentinula raphanica]|nr:P-loop containing nucleoside triphosphate hydrolase protein [Lentinula raphanica]